MAAHHLPAVTTALIAGAMGVGAVRAMRAMRALYPPPLAARPAEGTVPRHDDKRLTAAC